MWRACRELAARGLSARGRAPLARDLATVGGSTQRSSAVAPVRLALEVRTGSTRGAICGRRGAHACHPQVQHPRRRAQGHVVVLGSQAGVRGGTAARASTQCTGETAFGPGSIAGTAEVCCAATACASVDTTSGPCICQIQRRKSCPLVGTARAFALVFLSVWARALAQSHSAIGRPGASCARI